MKYLWKQVNSVSVQILVKKSVKKSKKIITKNTLRILSVILLRFKSNLSIILRLRYNLIYHFLHNKILLYWL